MLTNNRVLLPSLAGCFLLGWLAVVVRTIQQGNSGYITWFCMASSGVVVILLMLFLAPSLAVFNTTAPAERKQRENIHLFEFLQRINREKSLQRPENEVSPAEWLRDDAAREIRRLKEKCNTMQDYIESQTTEFSTLQHENARLREKCNLQLEYIETFAKQEPAQNVPPQENNNSVNNTVGNFAAYLQECFIHLEKKGLTIRPKRKNQNFIYISSTEFFGFLSKKIPGVNRKNILATLGDNGVVDITDKALETVYKGKRVLKVLSEPFEALTKEVA